jgi:dienelactone hydrolase
MKVKQTFFTSENKKIGGFLYYPSGEGPFPAVVFVHGFSGGTHELKNKQMCEALAQAGILVFMFDFYDKPNGLSDISISDMTVSLQLRILRCAVDFVCDLKDVDKTRIGLTGHSLGGMTVMLYASSDSRIKALVVQSGLSDFGQSRSTAFGLHADWEKAGVKLMERSWGSFLLKYVFIEDGLKHDVYGALDKTQCPVLVFHGDEDEAIDVEQAYKQKEHLKYKDKLVIIKGADHCYKKNETLPVATQLLVDFMKEKL